MPLCPCYLDYSLFPPLLVPMLVRLARPPALEQVMPVVTKPAVPPSRLLVVPVRPFLKTPPPCRTDGRVIPAGLRRPAVATVTRPPPVQDPCPKGSVVLRGEDPTRRPALAFLSCRPRRPVDRHTVAGGLPFAP